MVLKHEDNFTSIKSQKQTCSAMSTVKGNYSWIFRNRNKLRWKYIIKDFFKEKPVWKMLIVKGPISLPVRKRFVSHTFSQECTGWRHIGMCLGSYFSHTRALSDRAKKEQSKPFECMHVRQSSRHYRRQSLPCVAEMQ